MKRLAWVAALLCLGGWDLFQSPNPEVKRGNEQFKDGHYDEAIGAYREALKSLGDKGKAGAGVHFDLGAALYQKAVNAPPGAEREKLLDEAMKELESSTSEPSVESQAHYNLGNTLFQKEKYPEAIQEYKKSLKIDPKNPDAKYNLELALRKRNPQQQQQQQNQNQNQPPQNQGQGQNQQPNQGQQGQQQNQPQQNQGQGQQQNQQPQQNPQQNPTQQQPQQGQNQNQNQNQGQNQNQDQNQGQKPDQNPDQNPDQQQQGGQKDQQDQQDQKDQQDPQPGDRPQEQHAQETDADRKMDALERRSKNLQVDKQRSRAQLKRKVLKDW